MVEHLYQTIVLTRKLATGSIHDYLFCYCPLVGILFDVLRIGSVIFRMLNLGTEHLMKYPPPPGIMCVTITCLVVVL